MSAPESPALPALALAALLLSLTGATGAATVPAGFVDSVYAVVPTDATAMEFAPDGRLFVAQQSGHLRIVDQGRLLSTPFLTVAVDAQGERGLLGIAFDPGFARNGHLYVYYTATSPVVHNRVSRFTANANTAFAGSERVLLDLEPLGTSAHHNGGALHFGPDGKLYVAVGDRTRATLAQSLDNPFGKILRLNRDGSIPADNPFYDRTTGRNRAIWALGLRNPFTTALQPSTGRLYINDVGGKAWEEINEGRAGANYGWPAAEGFSSNPAYTNPVHAYGHVDGACAITGGTFYEPAVLAFPSWYFGQYFFADFCGNWIRRYNPQNGAVAAFATGVRGPVDLGVGPDGALYYLARRAGYVGRIARDAAQPPVITLQPADRTVAVGQSVTFRVSASGTPPLSFQWRRNGIAIPGATAATHTRHDVQLTDNGALFDVAVANAFGRRVSETARLTVLQNSVPTATITQPVVGTTYAGGDVVTYAGTASDPEDGTLPPAAFTWWVNLHHDGHAHPHVLPVSGSRSGSFRVPVTGETSANVHYRIHLRVRDSVGLARTVVRDVLPRKRTITLDSNPTGLQLLLDGRAVTTPYSFVGVVGIRRTIEAPSPQHAAGTRWVFEAWSDGGARLHAISTPSTRTTYTARYNAE